ncbi:MAG: hypothetical protein IJK93_04090 [Muribaculaceae bacterium]|nr:hypothetical protein [Muribaculaceae bacterium]
MKKLSFLMLSLLAVTMLTACGNDDEPQSKQTITSTINCRAIEYGEVLFSQGSATIELNFSDMFLKITSDYKDAAGRSHSLTTSDMKLYSVTSTVYSFNNMASSTYAGFDMFEGFIDMATGMLWYTFMIDGTTTVVCTSHLLYAYTTTTMTNPENGNHGSHQQSAYLFAPDSKGETCIMQISNFMSNLNGVVDAAELQYQGLTLTPTAFGYTITADMVESNYKGYFTLTDVNITLNDQCQVISGSFKCNGLEYSLSGDLFSFPQ